MSLPAAVRVRPAGDRAALVDVGSTARAAALAAACVADPLPGQVDAVCGAASVMLVVDRPFETAALGRHLDALVATAGAAAPASAQEHVVEVVYDGEDLDEVAEITGLGRDGVVAAHTGAPWSVGFGGFAPGFAYLVGGDPRLEVPRRSASRPRVPAGAVGLAGEHSGVYPRASPGGWQLIGRTAARLWDASRTPAALLAPGDTLRFRAVDRLDDGDADAPDGADADAPGGVTTADAARTSRLEGERSGPPALEVRRVGLQALVVDAGRPGRAGTGVPRSGPMDRAALVAANTAVGNPPWTAALEVVGGLRVAARGDLVVVVAGAPADLSATTGGVVRRREHGRALALRDGEVLDVGPPTSGVRSYLAVRGGLDVPAVLGSRCTDTLSGLGPAPLAAGDVLAVGAAAIRAATSPVVPLPSAASSPPSAPSASAARPLVRDAHGGGEADGSVVLDVVVGPRDDWFVPDAVATLADQPWEVGARSDRVGLRLAAGRPLVRERDEELPTEAVATGSLQVSPDGDLVLFAVDHPVTGGYPVIAVVVDAHLDRVGQLRPGDRVRFRPTDPGATPTNPPEDRCAPS